MKKSISIKEMILLGILVVILAYYLIIHQPILKQTEEIANEQEEILSEIDIQSAQLTQKRSMEAAIKAAFEEANGEPVQMPAYDNSNAVIMELNALLAPSNDYNIDFKGEDNSTTPYVLRRNIQLSFTAEDNDTAMSILRDIKASGLEFKIGNVNIARERTKIEGTQGKVSVSLNMTCCEYLGSE